MKPLLLTLKEEILFNLKKCLKKELRKENSKFSSLYSLNLKQIIFLKKHYKLEFNSLFLSLFCFYKKDFLNKPEELKLFNNHNIIIRLSEELLFLNESNLNDFLYKYTNSSEFVIFKNKTLVNATAFFVNRDVKHPIKINKAIRANDQYIPPYNDFYYVFNFIKENNEGKEELYTKNIAIGNKDFSFNSIVIKEN